MVNVPESFSIAVHTLALLAEKPGVPLAGKAVAEALGLSPSHVAKVLPRLSRAGLLDSRPGPSGGVCFTRDPKTVTLAMIQNAIEGQTVPRNGCLLPRKACPGNRCALGCFLSKTEAEFRRVFQTTTLADILRGVKVKKVKRN